MNVDRYKKLAEANRKVGIDSIVDIFDLVDDYSKKKYKSIHTRVEELANIGYGSVDIRLSKFFDLYFVIEDLEYGYSLKIVFDMLIHAGFGLDPMNDLPDSQIFTLIWHKDLPKYFEMIRMKI